MASAFQDVLRMFRVRTALSTAYGYLDNRNASPSCDENGSIYTISSPPAVGSTGSATNYGPSGLLIPGSNSRLVQIGGFNDGGAAAYLQLFNLAVSPPAPAAVPFQSFLVPAGGTFGWTPGNGGYFLSTGLVYAVSSTPATYTALVQDFWVFMMSQS